MIFSLARGDIDGWRDLFSRLLHPPLGHLAHISPLQARAYWFAEVKRDLADQSAAAWIARTGDEPDGLLLFLDAPWESKVMGKPVGTLRHFSTAHEGGRGNETLQELLPCALQHAARRGIHCLTVKVQPSEIPATHVLERNGFLLMDSLLDFVFNYPATEISAESTAVVKTSATILPATEADLPAAVAIAEKAFADYFGRYHADPRISRAAATNFYREWVQSSFRGWADLILVAEIDRRMAGFGIWKKATELEDEHRLGLAHYNLAAIHPEFSGRGLYSALAAEGMARRQGLAAHLVGPVHVSNFPVHRALQRLGWKIRGARYSFHKWL